MMFGCGKDGEEKKLGRQAFGVPDQAVISVQGSAVGREAIKRERTDRLRFKKTTTKELREPMSYSAFRHQPRGE